MKIKTVLPHSKFHLTRYHLLFLFTLSFIGIFLSVFSYTKLRDLEQTKFSTEFKREAENRIFALQRNINDKIDKILSLKALFDASEQVEKVEFQTFTKSLLQYTTGIQALEWIPHVPDAERWLYEELARQNGFSDFQITEREEQGLMVRAGKRDEYFPVYYLEPLEGNEMALGFDLASNPLRREALKSSGDTSEMKATAKIALVQETRTQTAFLVFHPLYNKEISADSVESRRKNLKGFVLGVFRVEDLVEDTLSVINPGGVDLYLYDENELNPGKRFLYSHASRNRSETSLQIKNEAAIKQGYYYSMPVRVADRTWQVYAVPTPGFLAEYKDWESWGVPGIILIFIMFCVGSLFFILDRAEEGRRHAQALAQTINKLEFEIVERNRVEKALLKEKENLNEALAEIKTLRGIIPICSYCKKIRDDKGLWKQLEAYLHSHSEAEFTHGACPECFNKQMEGIEQIKKDTEH